MRNKLDEGFLNNPAFIQNQKYFHHHYLGCAIQTKRPWTLDNVEKGGEGGSSETFHFIQGGGRASLQSYIIVNEHRANFLYMLYFYLMNRYNIGLFIILVFLNVNKLLV